MNCSRPQYQNKNSYEASNRSQTNFSCTCSIPLVGKDSTWFWCRMTWNSGNQTFPLTYNWNSVSPSFLLDFMKLITKNLRSVLNRDRTRSEHWFRNYIRWIQTIFDFANCLTTPFFYLIFRNLYIIQCNS